MPNCSSWGASTRLSDRTHVTATKFSTYVNFRKSSTDYNWLEDPTQANYWCYKSSNKVFGKSRCGDLHHVNSDRFTWYRPFSCLIVSDNRTVIGVNESCPDLDIVVLSAYSYVDGQKPYEHPGVLWIEFKTRLKINEWHYIELNVQEDHTDYFLRTQEGTEETITVKTTKCSLGPDGYVLSLWFGGECPAPQDVELCYKGETEA